MEKYFSLDIFKRQKITCFLTSNHKNHTIETSCLGRQCGLGLPHYARLGAVAGLGPARA